MIRFSARLVVAVALAVPLLAGPDRAEAQGQTQGQAEARGQAASDWARTEQTALRLVSAAAATGSGQAVRLALQFRMSPGWKIYWRSPGDAGYPPRADWTGSDNLAGAEIAWPAPTRFEVLGMQTLGYKDEVLLPVTARPEVPGAPMRLRAKIDYLACADICIPYEASLALDLPAGPTAPTAHTHLIDRFEARVPGPPSGMMAIERAALGGPRAKPALRISARAARPFSSPDVFVEGASDFWFGPPEVQLREGGYLAELRVPIGVEPGMAAGLVGQRLTVTLVDRGGEGPPRSLEDRVEIGKAALETPTVAAFAAMIGIALLGGLILNLMPCVLPVLSLKLLTVIRHGGADAARVRRSFIATFAGIVATFLLLGAVLVGLRLAGVSVGWGIQFQQPLFLIAMALVVTLFAANLWGFFAIDLPSGVATAIVRADSAHRADGVLGPFLAGVFATLLATPCSAPFLGTAVGFALARGPVEIMSIFAALGVGMALPYLAIAARPGLATRLPRPGPWMGKMQAVLGFALAGTAVWLLSVLAVQAGRAAALAVGAAMIAAVLLLGARRRLGAGAAKLATVLVVPIAVAAFAAPALLPPAGAPARPETSRIQWRPFDRAAIPALVAAGKTVFVDVTADWCITCQVNKSLVLETDEMAPWFARADMVAMRADWTLPDPAISDYLASFERYGIPFNAVYGPGAPGGIDLPEILTGDAVRAALRKAGGAESQTPDSSS